MNRTKTKKFIIISMIVHIIFFLIIGKEGIKEKKLLDPLRVKIIEEAPKPQGVIEELAKPAKIEKPEQAKILSKYSSKAHSDLSEKKSDKPGVKKPFDIPGKDAPKIETKKSEPSKPKVPVKKKKVLPKKQEKKTLAKIEKKKELVKSSKKVVREQKKEMKKEITKQVRSSVAKKARPSSQERKSQESVKGLPLLSTKDLQKYAKKSPGEEGEGSDGEVISLNTKEFKYVSYFASIKRQIKLVWAYPVEAQENGIHGYLYLKFTILKDGKLESVVLIRSSGHKILDDEALNAIKTASPYNPIPERLARKKITIEASFHYLPRVLYVR